MTLRDIAAVTGFHFTTVGIALRGDPSLPKETIVTIRAAARRLGYRPSPLLSALSAMRNHPKQQLTGIIGFLCTFDPGAGSAAGPRAERMFAAASSRAEQIGFILEPIRVSLTESRPVHVAAMLRARGITSIILAPLMPKAGPFLDLPWAEFCVVAIGYSITNLPAHRVCFSHFQGMLHQLRMLRARGYKRIGLAISEEVNTRSNGTLMGAWFADQHAHRLKPLISPFMLSPPKEPSGELVRWIRQGKLDCVICDGPGPYEWVKREGLRVPADIGIALLSRDQESTQIAGIAELDCALGEAAVDFAVSLLRLDERGLPEHPRYAMIESEWVFRPTVRGTLAPAATAAERTANSRRQNSV